METTDEPPLSLHGFPSLIDVSGPEGVLSKVTFQLGIARELPLEGFCNWKENGTFEKMRKDQFVRDSHGRELCHPWRLVNEAMVKSGRGVSLFIKNVVFHLN